MSGDIHNDSDHNWKSFQERHAIVAWDSEHEHIHHALRNVPLSVISVEKSHEGDQWRVPVVRSGPGYLYVNLDTTFRIADLLLQRGIELERDSVRLRVNGYRLIITFIWKAGENGVGYRFGKVRGSRLHICHEKYSVPVEG